MSSMVDVNPYHGRETAPRTMGVQKVPPPPCQHRETTWFESYLIETENILTKPIFSVIFFILAIWDGTLVFEILQTYEFFCLKENVLIKEIGVCVISIVTHFILLWACMQYIRRVFLKVTLGKDVRRIGDLREHRSTNLKDIPTLKLDDVIRRYAWQKLLETSSEPVKDFLLMHQYRFTCYIDWNTLTFEHGVPKFSPKVKDGRVIETRPGDVQTGDQWITLLSGFYDNKTGNKQSHSFEGSRDTTSYVDVDLEQCYTVNKKVCVNLNLSEIPIPVGLYMEKDNNLNLKKDNNRVLGETRTWKVNSQIEVEPSSRAHAQLLARRECSVVEFEIRTTLSIPKGAFEVTFVFESRDAELDVDIKNILEVFRLEEEGGVLRPEEKMFVELTEEKWLDKDGVEHSTFHPQIITRGTCVCLNWTDQKVDIKTSPLSMDESISHGDHTINETPMDRSIEDLGLNSLVVVN